MYFFFIILAFIPIFLSHPTVSLHLLQSSNKTYYEKFLRNRQDAAYFVSLGFGSSKQVFSLIFDTGSADLYIPSSKNKKCQKKNRKLSNHNKTVHPLFDCKKSKTCHWTDNTLELSYGDGDVYTYIVEDTVYLTDELSNEKQSFLVDYDYSGNFDCNGILGMGYHSLARNQKPSLMMNLLEKNKIEKNIFSIYLTTNSTKGSKLVLGGYDPIYLRNKNEIFYFPILDGRFYRINIDYFALGENLIEIKESAIIDSGSSLITLSESLSDNLLGIFKKKHNIDCYYLPEEGSPSYSQIVCSIDLKSNKLPDFSIIYKNQLLKLKPEDYIDFCQKEDAEVFCVLKIESTSWTSIILGDTIMHSYYTIFDLEESRIGFSRNINENKIKMSKNRIIDRNKLIDMKLNKKNIDNNVEDDRNLTKNIIIGILAITPIMILIMFALRRKNYVSEENSYLIAGISFIIMVVAINITIIFIKI